MTFLSKILSSDRTKSNGQINTEYKDLPEYAMDEQYKYPVTAATEPVHQLNILNMNKDELIIFALDMYGLKLHRKMSEGNMVKEIYDSINIQDYIPPENRVRRVVKKSDNPRPVGRPKGSKNKEKKDSLIEKL